MGQLKWMNKEIGQFQSHLRLGASSPDPLAAKPTTSLFSQASSLSRKNSLFTALDFEDDPKPTLTFHMPCTTAHAALAVSELTIKLECSCGSGKLVGTGRAGVDLDSLSRLILTRQLRLHPPLCPLSHRCMWSFLHNLNPLLTCQCSESGCRCAPGPVTLRLAGPVTLHTALYPLPQLETATLAPTGSPKYKSGDPRLVVSYTMYHQNTGRGRGGKSCAGMGLESEAAAERSSCWCGWAGMGNLVRDWLVLEKIKPVEIGRNLRWLRNLCRSCYMSHAASVCVTYAPFQLVLFRRVQACRVNRAVVYDD